MNPKLKDALDNLEEDCTNKLVDKSAGRLIGATVKKAIRRFQAEHRKGDLATSCKALKALQEHLASIESQADWRPSRWDETEVARVARRLAGLSDEAIEKRVLDYEFERDLLNHDRAP